MNFASQRAWSGSRMENMCKTDTTKSSNSLEFLVEGFEPVLKRRSRNFGDRLDHKLCTVCSSCRSCSEPSRTDLRSASPTNLWVSSFVLRSDCIWLMSASWEAVAVLSVISSPDEMRWDEMEYECFFLVTFCCFQSDCIRALGSKDWLDREVGILRCLSRISLE